MAGLANFSWRDLERLFAKGGAKLRFDVAAVHPFSGRPSNSVKIVAPQPRGARPPRRHEQADLAHRADVVLGQGQEAEADPELGDDRGRAGAAPARRPTGSSCARAAPCAWSASTGTRGPTSTATRRTRSTTRACAPSALTAAWSTSLRRGRSAPLCAATAEAAAGGAPRLAGLRGGGVQPDSAVMPQRAASPSPWPPTARAGRAGTNDAAARSRPPRGR